MPPSYTSTMRVAARVLLRRAVLHERQARRRAGRTRDVVAVRVAVQHEPHVVVASRGPRRHSWPPLPRVHAEQQRRRVRGVGLVASGGGGRRRARRGPRPCSCASVASRNASWPPRSSRPSPVSGSHESRPIDRRRACPTRSTQVQRVVPGRRARGTPRARRQSPSPPQPVGVGEAAVVVAARHPQGSLEPAAAGSSARRTSSGRPRSVRSPLATTKSTSQRAGSRSPPRASSGTRSRRRSKHGGTDSPPIVCDRARALLADVHVVQHGDPARAAGPPGAASVRERRPGSRARGDRLPARAQLVAVARVRAQVVDAGDVDGLAPTSRSRRALPRPSARATRTSCRPAPRSATRPGSRAGRR